MKRFVSVGIIGTLAVWGFLAIRPELNLLLGALAGGFLAGAAAFRMGWLSRDGAIGAGIMLTTIVSVSGLPALVVPSAFLASSSLLGKLPHKGIRPTSERRNAVQVAANGAVGLACLVIHVWSGVDAFLYAFAGAFAAASADTWATEIGRRSEAAPRLITSMKQVTPGLSGGVTRLGLLASVGGAAFAAASAIVLIGFDVRGLLIIGVSGVVGSLIDSLAGASVQARYGEHTTGTWSDNPVGALVHGFRWVDNDAVNLICTLTGAFLAGVLAVPG